MVVVCTWEILHNRLLLENSSFLQVFKGDNDNWRWRRQPWRIKRRWIVDVVPVLIRVNILINTRSSSSSLHSSLKNLRVSRSGRENATRMVLELCYCLSSVKYITLHPSTYMKRGRRRRNSPTAISKKSEESKKGRLLDDKPAVWTAVRAAVQWNYILSPLRRTFPFIHLLRNHHCIVIIAFPLCKV